MYYFVLGTALISLISCSKRAGTVVTVPATLQQTLKQPVFSTPTPSSNNNTSSSTISQETPIDPSAAVRTGNEVSDKLDSKQPSLVTFDPNAQVVHCDRARYEWEKQTALDAAKRDLTKKTIPVRFTISTGTFHDELAYLAHLRSILQISNVGGFVRRSFDVTPIPVGSADKLDACNNASSFRYLANHVNARANFIRGARCFFDTVTVVGTESGQGILLNGVYNHSYNVMYFGDVYPNPNDVQVREGLKSPRLFKKLEESDYNAMDPQIIPLYVADIRDSLPTLEGYRVQILNPTFVSSATRLEEYSVSFRKIFNLPLVNRHRDSIVQVYSNPRAFTGTDGKTYNLNAYEGVPQLIDWLIYSGLESTVMSTNYTPLVLDLGRSQIQTSSVDWGTFFNLGALQNINEWHPVNRYRISHQTAWIGGALKPVLSTLAGSYVRPVADDGFLFMANSGEIVSAKNLFSPFSEIPGNTSTLTDGFDALRKYSGKKCETSNLKERFIGPWDGVLYTQYLKVWVDANRNGTAEVLETVPLAQVGVQAIDTCSVTGKESDAFGNETSLRSPFLYSMQPLSQEEILFQLVKGYSSRDRNRKSEFRVMIDIKFKANPGMYLEDIEPVAVR